MIRHPIWLAVEALAALAITALGSTGLHQPMPPPHELSFGLTALGELEQPDGSWRGVDLLREPDSVDRFQLTVHADEDVQLTVDVLSPHGTRRIFPPAGRDGVLHADALYALPAPNSFYALEGNARVRVSVRPVGRSDDALPLAAVLPSYSEQSYALSDGSRFESLDRFYLAPHGGSVDLDLSSPHQGIVVPSPTTSE